MLNPLRTAAREMLASMFLQGGLDVLRNPEPRAKVAAPVIAQLREVAPFLPADDVAVVRANAAVQVAAASLLAAGKATRLAALVLAASLVPTTLGGHRFWTIDDPVQRAQQRTHFNKNVALLGGLLLLAASPRSTKRKQDEG